MAVCELELRSPTLCKSKVFHASTELILPAFLRTHFVQIGFVNTTEVVLGQAQ